MSGIPSTALTASRLAAAAQFDPQMRAPDRPRIVRGVSRVRLPDGLLVVGGADRVLLRGSFATNSLGGLMDLLDGTRGLTELTEESGLPSSSVSAAVALLYAKGLIEDALTSGPTGVPDTVLDALSRRAPLTRVRASGEEAATALVDTPFLLTGDEGPVRLDRVASMLRDAGARHVEIVDGVPGEPPSGAVVLLSGTSPAVAEAARRVSESHAMGLPLREVGGLSLLGPFLRDDLPCPECAERIIQEVTGEPAAGDTETAEPSPPSPAGALDAIVTAHLVGSVTRTSPLRLLRRLLSLDLGSWEEKEYFAPALPGCARCSSAEAPVDGRPLVLEDILTFPPRDALDPSSHLAHYAPTNIALQQSRRALSGESGEPITASPLDDWPGLGAAVGQLALRTFGLREPLPGRPVRRWAPTGGNIGSPQLDLIVPEAVEGLESGVWSFDPFEARLVRIGSGHKLGLGIPPGSIAAVLTGGLERMGSKYGASAYRLIHLDAGVSRFQMLRVAYELGLAARPLEDWDDSGFTRAVAGDPLNGPITSVVLLGSSEELLGEPSEAPDGPAAVPAPEHGLMALSRSTDTLVGSMINSMAEHGGLSPLRLPGTLALERAGAAGGGLEQVLRDRSSTRRWHPGPVPLTAIEHTSREIALGASAVRTPGGCPVSTVLIAQRVDGLARGAYAVTEEGGLRFIKPLGAGALKDAVLQPEYVDSPALFVGLAPLAEVVARNGTLGYRRALTEVGSALHAGWLGGVEAGLSGGIFAGILPDSSARLTDGHPVSSRPVLGMALGLPEAL